LILSTRGCHPGSRVTIFLQPIRAADQLFSGNINLPRVIDIDMPSTVPQVDDVRCAGLTERYRVKTDIEIRRLMPADAARYREIRLAGLKSSPEAFGSTFETESVRPLSSFSERLDAAAVFGAFHGAELWGIAGFAARNGVKEAHKGLLWCMYVR